MEVAGTTEIEPSQAEVPQACDLIIRNGVLLTLDPDDRVIEGGALAVVDGRIVAIGDDQCLADRYQASEILNAHGSIVHPGFIDAHAHVNQYSSRSALPALAQSDLTMGHWKAALRPEDERASTALAAIDYLNSGYTAFVDPGTVVEPEA
ncbi:MAG TPA: hypothetical protein EYP07_04330, partial [Kiloniellaceae bacterium]|nr:hypothetical protein [Kiloniellaceae bacterium]